MNNNLDIDFILNRIKELRNPKLRISTQQVKSSTKLIKSYWSVEMANDLQLLSGINDDSAESMMLLLDKELNKKRI